MSDEELRIKLNLGMPVEICGMRVKQYTLNQIIEDIGYTKFLNLRNFVNLGIDDFEEDVAKQVDEFMFQIKEMLILQNAGVNYDITYTLFDMCGYLPFIQNIFLNFLHIFTDGYNDISIKHNPLFDTLTIFYSSVEEGKNKANQLVLDREKFDNLIDLFSILNFTVRVERTKIKDSESVKEFDKEVEEIKARHGFKSKQDVTLESIISALIDSNNTSYTHENIRSKTIYQIMNSFNRMCKIKDNEFMNLIRVNASKIKEDDIKKSVWYYNLY